MGKYKSGTFFLNDDDRIDIMYSNGNTHGGLHCGDTLEVQINGKWIPTRIEMGDDDWYLVGVKNIDLIGLNARIE